MARAFRIFAALAVLIGFGWPEAHAAVANQSCTPAVGSTTGQHFTANTTFSFTNVTISAGSNLALTVQIFVDANTTPTVSSIVWDSVGANQSLAQVNPGAVSVRNIETWALVNPTPGTNKTISITISASTAIFAQACVWTGVNQTGGATSFPHTSSSAGVATTTITSATGNIVLGGGTTGAVIVSVTGTTIFTDSLSGAVVNAFGNFANGSASVVIGQANNNDVVSATDIQASAGGASCPHTLSTLGAGC